MSEMAEVPEKSDSTETLMCLFPGCESPAVPPPNKTGNPRRQGPPPRFCERDDHNAASTYQQRRRLDNEAAAD